MKTTLRLLSVVLALAVAESSLLSSVHAGGFSFGGKSSGGGSSSFRSLGSSSGNSLRNFSSNQNFTSKLGSSGLSNLGSRGITNQVFSKPNTNLSNLGSRLSNGNHTTISNKLPSFVSNRLGNNLVKQPTLVNNLHSHKTSIGVSNLIGHSLGHKALPFCGTNPTGHHHHNPCFTFRFPVCNHTCPPTTIVEQNTVIVEKPVIVEQPVAAAPPAPQVPVGSTLTLQAMNVGPQGQVILEVNGLQLGTLVQSWDANGVVVTLPMLGLAGPAPAKLTMVLANGQPAGGMDLVLLPAQVAPPAGPVVRP